MRIAIIIPGLLRSLGNTAQYFNSLPKDVDIFICTNKSEKTKIKLLKNLRKVQYIEDVTYLKNQQSSLLKLPEGAKILQWQKLSVGFAMLCEHEAIQGFKYDYIYKLRTDLAFSENHDFDFLFKERMPERVYMNSDIYFGAQRPAFEVCSSFFIHALSHYYNRKTFNYFDLNLLSQCDKTAGKFEWLNYPSEISQNYKKFDDFWHAIEHGFHETKTSSTTVFNYRENADSIVFPSESAFLNFVLSNNLAVKVISEDLLRIRPDRKQEEQNDSKFDNLLLLFKKKDFNNMLLLCASHSFSHPEAADVFRDAALECFESDNKLGLRLITQSLKLRPNGPYIRRLKADFEKIMLAKKIGKWHEKADR